MQKLFKSLIIVLCTLSITLVSAQKSKKKKNDTKPSTEQTDAKAEKKDKDAIKPFEKLIIKPEIADSGLFNYYKVEDKYYLEIPDSLLNREMLMVTRIAKTADKIGYGGENTDNQVLRWEKRDKKIFVRIVSHNNVAADSLPIYESVKNSNFEPILLAFDIKGISKDSAGTIIEISDFLLGDVKPFGLDENRRKQYKVSSLDKGRSYVESVKSFPINIEFRRVLSYNASEAPSNKDAGVISLEVNNSMVLLPIEPMMPRIYDERVGFFSLSQNDFGLDEQRASSRKYIVRWRLEPKDPEAFARGELVEPIKPIIYYIDPATPEKWRPYLKQGVNDWQVAFEAAGFKNAIYALDPPSKEEDPDWSPEDARYSVIRYFASPVQNAYGPNVHDPRSGEILESDIGWFHNVMNLLRNWYFIQTSAINPKARSVKFDDEEMGQLIRFVSAHEVGHTIGLAHNMGASSSYPVDSLRSASFTQKMGTAPSIMDYARFNYVAQPEDVGVALYPQIGVYDKHAIRWGYRPILDAKTSTDESELLNQWILEKADNPMYRYGRQRVVPLDPSAQTEDLGDNAMRASYYGIENLKRIVPNLIEWTSTEGKNYDDLDELYNQVISQYNRYFNHVITHIGGAYENFKTSEQAGAVYTPVEYSKQKEALDFVINVFFKTPKWLLDPEILGRIESAGAINSINKIQTGGLNSILSPSRLARVIEYNSIYNNKLSLPDLMETIRYGVWSELRGGASSIDVFRRSLQRGHIERLEYLLNAEDQKSSSASFADFFSVTSIDISQSDIKSTAREELKLLKRDITLSKGRFRDKASIYHLEESIDRIDKILNPK